MQRPRRQPEAVQCPGAVPAHDDVRGRQQLLERPSVGRASEVEKGRSLARAGVEVLGRDLGQPRAVDPQDVGAEEGEGPGADRAGDDPGQVEDADPGGGPAALAGRAMPRAGRVPVAQAVHTGQGQPGEGTALRVLSPPGGVPYGRGHAAVRHHPVLDLGRGQRGHGRPDRGCRVGRGVGDPERRPQPGPMVRVVAVQPHPAVRRGQEGRQRIHADLRPAVEAQMPFAGEGRGHRAAVDRQRLPAAWARSRGYGCLRGYGVEFAGREPDDGHARLGERADRQPCWQGLRRTDDRHRVLAGKLAAERSRGFGDHLPNMTKM